MSLLIGSNPRRLTRPAPRGSARRPVSPPTRDSIPQMATNPDISWLSAISGRVVGGVLGEESVEALAGLLEDLSGTRDLNIVARLGHLHDGRGDADPNVPEFGEGTAVVPHGPRRRAALGAPGSFLSAGVGQVKDPFTVGVARPDEALVLELLERGVDRAGARTPHAAASFGELLDDLVAMHGLCRQQPEDGRPHIAPADLRAATEEGAREATGAELAEVGSPLPPSVALAVPSPTLPAGAHHPPVFVIGEVALGVTGVMVRRAVAPRGRRRPPLNQFPEIPSVSVSPGVVGGSCGHGDPPVVLSRWLTIYRDTPRGQGGAEPSALASTCRRPQQIVRRKKLSCAARSPRAAEVSPGPSSRGRARGSSRPPPSPCSRCCSRRKSRRPY